MPLEERRLFFSRSSNNPPKKRYRKKQVFKVARRPSSVTSMAATVNHWSSFTIQYSPKKVTSSCHLVVEGFSGHTCGPPKNPGCQWRPGGHIPKVKGLSVSLPKPDPEASFTGIPNIFPRRIMWLKQASHFSVFFLLLEIGDFLVQFQA